MINKLLTKNFKSVPLIYITFNLQKFRKFGAKGSCDLRLHPELKNDEYIVEKMKEITDYIRENYDMERIV